MYFTESRWVDLGSTPLIRLIFLVLNNKRPETVICLVVSVKQGPISSPYRPDSLCVWGLSRGRESVPPSRGKWRTTGAWNKGRVYGARSFHVMRQSYSKATGCNLKWHRVDRDRKEEKDKESGCRHRTLLNPPTRRRRPYFICPRRYLLWVQSHFVILLQEGPSDTLVLQFSPSFFRSMFYF